MRLADRVTSYVRRWIGLAARILLLAVVYFVAGRLSFSISQENMVVTIVVFASEGFALAAVLIYGRRMWPGVFIGQLWLAASAGLPVMAAMGIAAVNSLEAIVAATLFNRFGLQRTMGRVRDVVGLILLVVLVLQPLSAGLGNLVLLLSSIIGWQSLPTNLFSWWFGNVMGQLLIAPTMLLLYANWKRLHVTGLMLLITLFLGLSWLIFIDMPISRMSIVFSITLPLIILVAVYRSLTEAMIMVTLVAVVALYATSMGKGAFALGDLTDDIIDLNFYVLSHVLLVLFIGTLLEERQAAEKRLRSMALYDPLTGLPNRNLLKERMRHAIALAHRYGKNSAVCYIDIDDFKQVNDRYGHDAGDRVLRMVTQRIIEHLREDDSLIRLGGDEFLLIATDMKSKQAVEGLLDRISTAASEPVHLVADTVRVSLSIGVTMCPKDADDIDGLIAHADTAMYYAKQQGRNRVIFYHDLMTRILGQAI